MLLFLFFEHVLLLQSALRHRDATELYYDGYAIHTHTYTIYIYPRFSLSNEAAAAMVLTAE